MRVIYWFRFKSRVTSFVLEIQDASILTSFQCPGTRETDQISQEIHYNVVPYS